MYHKYFSQFGFLHFSAIFFNSAWIQIYCTFVTTQIKLVIKIKKLFDKNLKKQTVLICVGILFHTNFASHLKIARK